MAKRVKQKPMSEWKCTHIMADGTVRESMKGYTLPYNETTKIAYDLLATWLQRAANSEA